MDYLTLLAEKLGAALKARGLKLTLAESCTGGLVSTAITEIPGSSAWFDCGFVTYSNESKTMLLGVLPATLQKHGAVSEETAREMALGALDKSALKNCQAQISASITGIAGPDGGTADKPVGTVCFAWASSIDKKNAEKSTVSAATQHFTGNRKQIRQQAAAYLMQQLMDFLN